MTKTGGIRYNFPDREAWEMPEEHSCVLDVAERGGVTLEETGQVLNMTREGARLWEVKGLEHMAQRLPENDIREELQELERERDRRDTGFSDSQAGAGPEYVTNAAGCARWTDNQGVEKRRSP